jgi:hypothetical protein
LRLGKFSGGLLVAALALLSTLVSTSKGEAAGPGSSQTGYDISYPQCPSNFPRDGAFGIVGVTNGRAFSDNPCRAAEYQWAAGRPKVPAFYMNTANPGPISPHWNQGGPQPCVTPTSYSDTGCAYDYGWKAAEYAFGLAPAGTAATHDWWLDIETANSWNGTTDANRAAIDGYVAFLKGQGVLRVGLYSTGSQWQAITGGYSLGLPNWIAGNNTKSASGLCGSTGFSGGQVILAQYRSKGFDADYACF